LEWLLPTYNAYPYPDGILRANLVPDSVQTSVARVLVVRNQRLTFADGSWLNVTMNVERLDLRVTTYSFHYAADDDRIAWRKCSHDGHVDVDLQPSHIHYRSDERRYRYPAVDLEEALLEVRDELLGIDSVRPSL